MGKTPLPLGRVASRIAITLMGKHKPMYDPSTDCGDYVVALGCADLLVTGRKLEQKLYRTHTTRPGSLREITLGGLAAKYGGGEILKRAVKGMLPKNRLQDTRLARLRVFEGAAHPYKANILHWPGSPDALDLGGAQIPGKQVEGAIAPSTGGGSRTGQAAAEEEEDAALATQQRSSSDDKIPGGTTTLGLHTGSQTSGPGKRRTRFVRRTTVRQPILPPED